ncbi:head to tail joining protein [Caudoviricetes sp.]|nr:head to tail joining protein [Caudoviricetes sp.]
MKLTKYLNDNDNQDSAAGEKDASPGQFLKKVKDAESRRKTAKYDEMWSKMIRMYSNQYAYDELSAYEDIVAPNMIFSTVNVIVPSVAINYPKITVTARQKTDEQAAEVVESVANFYWRHFNTHDEFREAIKDFVIIGHGWLKTTWAFEEHDEEMTQEEWKQEVQRALMERNMGQEAAERQGITDATFPTDREIVNSVPTTKKVVSEDHPAVERVSPFDMFVDPAATRLKDARWIAQRAYVPIEVAKDNEAWDPRARKKLTSKAVTRDSVDVQKDSESKPNEEGFCVIWEFYNLITGEMCTFAEGCDLFLVKPEEVEYPGNHPYVFTANYTVPERFYPIGDVETIVPLQLELATTRTQMINDRKRFRRMYMVRSEELGESGMNALLSGDDNAIIEIEGSSPFADIIAPVTTAQLSAEFYNQSSMIIEDINFTAAVTEYQRGGQTEVRRTATEAGMIQDAANARSADKLAIIERAIGEVAERVVALTQANLTTEQVAKIVDEDGATRWVPYSPEDIEGQYDFTVEAGSTQPQNETFRRQSAMQLMDAMAPFIDMGVVDPVQLATHVLKNGFGVKNPEQFLVPPPPMDPMGVPGGVPPEGAPMPPMA